MGLGVPVVATEDAVNGMELESGQGLLLGGEGDLAGHVLRLIEDGGYARGQSEAARRSVERLYGLPNTYGRLCEELEGWLQGRRPGERVAA